MSKLKKKIERESMIHSSTRLKYDDCNKNFIKRIRVIKMTYLLPFNRIKIWRFESLEIKKFKFNNINFEHKLYMKSDKNYVHIKKKYVWASWSKIVTCTLCNSQRLKIEIHSPIIFRKKTNSLLYTKDMFDVVSN